MGFCRHLALAATACAVAGCAAPRGPFTAHLSSPVAELRECAEWYRALDDAVEAAGVRDAQHARIPGFPYLRADRMAAALRERAAGDERTLRAHVDRMLELDLRSRSFEIDNLPADAVPGIQEAGRRAFLRRTGQCAALLRDADLASAEARERLFERTVVPDDYSDFRRAVGLYPLTRHAFARGVRRWEADTAARFSAPPRAGSGRVRYAPPSAAPVARDTVAALLARANLDALGPQPLSESELLLLAAAYAPSFDVEIAADYDRFGELRWRRGSSTPVVDAADAVVYVQAAHTHYAGRVLLQLVYTVWFPERPPAGAFDLYAGSLDGVMWRVTLAPDGEPVLFDSIHPCGCFHLFIPTARARPRAAPDALEEWAFVPQRLPRLEEGERPVVSIASGSHAVEHVALVRGIDSLVRYSLRPYDELRSMQRMDGPGRRSAFGADGLIAGTERAERFLFWPMGITSAGAMRQWGRHATAFVGRRHFDDADLVERRFTLDLGEQAK
jgi:hypothetical protein